MPRPLRLLSISHSYVVALNRRIAHEISRESGGRWHVTVVSPDEMRGDLRPTPFERAANEPCEVEIVPVHWPQRIHFMLYGSKLNRILAQGWDMVHCWEEPYVCCGAQVAWRTPRKVPLVFYTFQNLLKQYPPPFSMMEKYVVARSAGWIAAGQTIQDVLLARKVGYEHRTNTIIPPGVDVQVFQPNPAARTNIRERFGWKKTDLVIGFLGRFVPEKGLDLLTRVLEQIRTPWRAMFVGAGPEEQSLRRWGQSRTDQVKIITNAAHDDVPTYLNAFDVLCAPSQTASHWREQFGRMLIEAFATGVPVIASDSGEIPFVVGDAGMVIPEKDEGCWERAISELLESPARRKEFSAKGLQRVHSRFAWPVVARQHLRFFEQLLAEKHPTHA